MTEQVVTKLLFIYYYSEWVCGYLGGWMRDEGGWVENPILKLISTLLEG